MGYSKIFYTFLPTPHILLNMRRAIETSDPVALRNVLQEIESDSRRLNTCGDAFAAICKTYASDKSRGEPLLRVLEDYGIVDVAQGYGGYSAPMPMSAAINAKAWWIVYRVSDYDVSLDMGEIKRVARDAVKDSELAKFVCASVVRLDEE